MPNHDIRHPKDEKLYPCLSLSRHSWDVVKAIRLSESLHITVRLSPITKSLPSSMNWNFGLYTIHIVSRWTESILAVILLTNMIDLNTEATRTEYLNSRRPYWLYLLLRLVSYSFGKVVSYSHLHRLISWSGSRHNAPLCPIISRSAWGGSLPATTYFHSVTPIWK